MISQKRYSTILYHSEQHNRKALLWSAFKASSYGAKKKETDLDCSVNSREETKAFYDKKMSRDIQLTPY